MWSYSQPQRTTAASVNPAQFPGVPVLPESHAQEKDQMDGQKEEFIPRSYTHITERGVGKIGVTMQG